MNRPDRYDYKVDLCDNLSLPIIKTTNNLL